MTRRTRHGLALLAWLALWLLVLGPLWLAAEVWVLAASGAWSVVILGENLRPGGRLATAWTGRFWVVTVR